MKTVIRVSCVDQVLRLIDRPLLASGGMNEAVVKFDFCEKWDGFAKTAVFYRDEEHPYHMILDENDTCVIPWEVYFEPGTFYFTVFGVKDETRKTANTLRYRAKKGFAGDETIPSEPTQEVYEQIMARMLEVEQGVSEERLTEVVNEAVEQAKANGDLDGEDGKSAYQYAQDGGYTGTEEEFAEKLASSSGYPNPCVMDYGAKGDGATNDTKAFQDALANNRVVIVPGGTYKLSGELVIGDNCCLELSQDTVLEFIQTSGNCITLGISSTLKGNHATVKVPYAFDGHVLHAYSNDHTDVDTQAVPPWSKWDPQWKTGRYVSDLNICKADSRGFHYAVNPDECKGTAVYISAKNVVGLSTFMWGVHYTGLRIAGAFAYGIHAQNFNDGWLHEMRIDGFIDACETGVCLEDCNNTYISAAIQPRRAYTEAKQYVPYAKYGIKLVRSKNTDLSGSRVWDWNATNTLWAEDNEYQHIAMYGECRGTILNDFYYYETTTDIRKQIYSDKKSNLDQMTILQEPIDRWFKIRNGEPYYNDGFADRKLVTQEIMDEHFTTDVVKNFTDVLPIATDKDGSVFGDVGYKYGYLLGNGDFEESSYYVTTGFIPLKVGQTLYVDGITYATYDGFCRICTYDADKNFVSLVSAQNVVKGNYYYMQYNSTNNGFAISPTNVVGNANVAFVRLSAYKRNVSDNPMLSIDEPIKYTVEGFLADGVKVKGENIIGIPGQTTPDWVATKKLEGGDTVYITEQTLTSGIWNKLQSSFQPDLPYDVYINGDVYTCIARASGQGVSLGNDAAMSLNDYPFCIEWAGGSATSGMFLRDSAVLSYPITLKVTDHAEAVYNKMPVGYLPDEAALKSDIPTDYATKQHVTDVAIQAMADMQTYVAGVENNILLEVDAKIQAELGVIENGSY